VVTFAASIASVLIPNPYTYIPAVLALGAQLSSWSIRLRAGRQHSIGEDGRMRGLLLNAIGSPGERIELANWLSRIDPAILERAPKSVDTSYFASNAPTGVRRLCEHVQENAFWGKSLYDIVAKRYTRLLCVLASVTLLALLVAIPFSSYGENLILARILVIIVSFGAVLTQANEILSWREAKEKIEAVDRRLEILTMLSEGELRSSRIEGVFAVYGDYCFATAVAPPIPRWVYVRERDRINGLWHQRSG
jgi:hypothetical protein